MVRSRGAAGALVCFAALLMTISGCTEKHSPEQQGGGDAAGFQEFSSRVKQYAQLHDRQEADLPKLKATDLPEMIAAHQSALARKIREARPDAQAGNIFGLPAAEAFQHAIAEEFRSDDAENARATMKQGAPVGDVQLAVNQVYPQELPFSSVPPTLLQKFPKLPDGLEYRIVGKDLILLDVKANLVVDVMSKAIP